ncbi:MarR family winged helix-turn-helix transcriptional regulator [Arthrobacter sp. UYCu712]|uniref:MarR family winged helix-turn-helix transcriptional regulator n=1 Tax=Arthrobacter sp. UYCu712 TaxID=3156340 RepID=UPI0033983817
MISPPAAEEWTTQQLLAMADRLVRRSQDRALTDLGLTHAAVTALQGLAAGPQSQNQLAARIRVRAQTMGGILTRLDAAGFITRVRDPRNRRRIEAALTSTGRTALEKARRTEIDLLPPGSSEPGTLRRELIKVIASFSSPAADPARAAAASSDAAATTFRARTPSTGNEGLAGSGHDGP